jgi:hypothetical protein
MKKQNLNETKSFEFSKDASFFTENSKAETKLISQDNFYEVERVSEQMFKKHLLHSLKTISFSKWCLLQRKQEKQDIGCV